MSQPYLVKIANIAVMCRFCHQTDVTSKSFLSFLEGYKTAHANEVANYNALAGRMTTGLLELFEEKDLVITNQKVDNVRMTTYMI